MTEEPDYYALLDVAPDADETAIRLAFRRQARRYHPDVADTGDAHQMARINAAYQVLSDPERRREYDLARGGASPRRAAMPDAPQHSARPTTPAPPATGTLRASAGPLRRLATLPMPDRAPVTALTFARGGQWVAAGLIDGRVLVFDLATGRLLHTLAFARGLGAGVLQEVRLSPSGRYAAAWGLLLGTRVWAVETERALWTSSANGPSGAMDLTLMDDPPRVRLALPDAPLALAGDDPFRWAHQGRAGTAVFTRPLEGPVDAVWAVPRRCAEAAAAGGGQRSARDGWRVYERMLSGDGQRLLTFTAPPTTGVTRPTEVHIWDLEYRALLGGVTTRRVVRAAYPAGVAWFPLATTPDFGWVATGYLEQRIRVAATQWHAERIVETGPLASDARAALAPDVSLLAVARGAQLDLWHTESAAHAQEWACGADVTALTFAQQAAAPLLALGLGNGVVEVWGH